MGISYELEVISDEFCKRSFQLL